VQRVRSFEPNDAGALAASRESYAGNTLGLHAPIALHKERVLRAHFVR
jgi:hypothetical protein